MAVNRPQRESSSSSGGGEARGVQSASTERCARSAWRRSTTSTTGDLAAPPLRERTRQDPSRRVTGTCAGISVRSRPP